MKKLELSYRSRKALSVHVGEAAATEIVGFLEELVERVEKLERGKVDVMHIVPIAQPRKSASQSRKAA